MPTQLTSAPASLGLISTVVGASANLKNPSDVAFDSSGNLYIADKENHRILKVDRDNNTSTVAGTGTADYSGDGGLATSAALNNPQGVAIDSSGNLYIADTDNQVIRKVDSAGIITTVAGTGSQDPRANGVPATSAKLNSPHGLAVDSSGNLYIADTGYHVIRKVDSAGTISTFAGYGKDIDGSGIQATSARLKSPYGVAVDSSDNLYIADTYFHRIRKVDGAGIISTVAGTGTADFSGDGGPAISAMLHAPLYIAIDSGGNVFFTDSWNQRIRKVDSAGIISTVAGTGSTGPSGDGMPATSATLNKPKGITLDSSGNLYIADSVNKCIRKVQMPFASVKTLTGSATFSIDDIVGSYVRKPPTNDWHYGDISRDGANLKWTNKASRSWGLTPDLGNNLLLTDESNPYQQMGTKNFEIVVTDGQITGFQFGVDFYERTG